MVLDGTSLFDVLYQLIQRLRSDSTASDTIRGDAWNVYLVIIIIGIIFFLYPR